jgi:hypothetical protein
MGPLDQSVIAIPYEVIAGFLGRPSLLEKNEVKTAPYLVAIRGDHMVGAAGNEIYARGLGNAETEARYNLIHVEEPIRDPENNDLLGYTGVYVGAGPIVTAGDPAKLVLLESSREAFQGDKLFPEATSTPLDFVPHPPATDVDAAVIAIQSLSIVGQYQILALNRGTESGLEPGNVLAIVQSQAPARGDYSRGGLGARKTKLTGWQLNRKTPLPEERVGLVMVFKAYDRMSICLVMESESEIRFGDRARNP